MIAAARAKVDEKTRAAKDGACWYWATPTQTRPKIAIDGRTLRAERVIIATEYDLPIDAAWVARHTCDDMLSVNPSHLEPGTHAQNSRDMASRGRHGRAQLTEASVREARKRKGQGDSLAAIAADAGVTKSAIWSATNGRTWTWLE